MLNKALRKNFDKKWEQRSTAACKNKVPPSYENGCVHGVLMIYPFWEKNNIIFIQLKLPVIDGCT